MFRIFEDQWRWSFLQHVYKDWLYALEMKEFPCDMTRVIPKQGLQQEHHHIWRCYCKPILVYLAHASGLLGLDNDINLLYKFPWASYALVVGWSQWHEFEGQLMASCNSSRITFSFKWNLPLLVFFGLEHTQIQDEKIFKSCFGALYARFAIVQNPSTMFLTLCRHCTQSQTLVSNLFEWYDNGVHCLLDALWVIRFS